MGHQLSRAALAAALTLAPAACGGSDGDADPPPVLDIAREQVAGAESEATSEPSGGDDEPIAPDELPLPDPSTFEGSNRVVNLWVGVDGATSEIDVWGRRTFTNGPLLLAEGIAFGEVSDYFAAPPRYSLVIVGAGAGPDGDELAGLLNAADGEQITTIYTNDDDQGAVSAPNLFERGSDQSPTAPADGNGLVVLFAPNVRAYSDSLINSIGGDAFYVGDGSATCRVQRVEATGLPPENLGGTQQVVLEVPPGPAAISLHPWFSPDECDQPSALDVTIDVIAGESSMVLVYSRDGMGIEYVVIPVAAR